MPPARRHHETADMPPEILTAMVDDLAYHQSRVLLLVRAVAEEPGNAGKLDGLTKLAKLDFLVRYPRWPPWSSTNWTETTRTST